MSSSQQKEGHEWRGERRLLVQRASDVLENEAEWQFGRENGGLARGRGGEQTRVHAERAVEEAGEEQAVELLELEADPGEPTHAEHARQEVVHHPLPEPLPPRKHS